MRQCGLSRTRSWEPFGAEDREVIADAGTAFLQPTPWKIAYASLKLPSWTPHPGGAPMRRAAINLRKVAERVLATRRQDRADGGELLGRLVTARDPGTGSKMPDNLIIDNVVTFLMVGQETTAQALSWTLYLLALFPEWQEKVREEVRRVDSTGPLERRSGPAAWPAGGGISGGDAALSTGTKPDADHKKAGQAGRCRAWA
jgi:cytochrome P450